MNRFPESFVWGAASSAYQIEGSPLADGGGESVWSRFCATPGHIANDDNGDIACDAYHRYAEDIELLAQMGLSAYRFSTSWARIDPTGTGQWNQSGLAYYDRLVDCCLSHGITPWLTLYHWETPQALEDRGGWLNPDTVEAFTRYAAMMAEHFKGRVKNYFTMNEPEIVLSLGYGSGIHAPGKHYDMGQLFTCLKHMLLASGSAMAAMRRLDPESKLGIVTTGRLCYPETPADSEAARAETFVLRDDDWLFTHSLILDPVCLGRFELEENTKLYSLARQITPEQWQIIQSSPDIIGLNTYNGTMVRATDRGAEYVPRSTGYPRTALKWPITPEIMSHSLSYIQQRYNKPLYITECGLSCNDKIYLDGGVHDPDRIDFLHRYLLALRAGLESSDVRGFFHWSLTDNFEWHSGYGERFGLVYVDYPTQRRILKDSAHWYSTTAITHGANL
jgi:beta-glucosidase